MQLPLVLMLLCMQTLHAEIWSAPAPEARRPNYCDSPADMRLYSAALEPSDAGLDDARAALEGADPSCMQMHGDSAILAAAYRSEKY